MRPVAHNFVDRTGQRFGHLTVLSIQDKHSYGVRWRCQCDCGEVALTTGPKLTSGHTKSCGCIKAANNRSHGCSHKNEGRPTPEYEAWHSMRGRCQNPNNAAYADYGGRGIVVDDRWRNFSTFLVDMGPRPSKLHTLDRYPDNDGGYSKDNCRWATRKQQANNRRKARRTRWSK